MMPPPNALRARVLASAAARPSRTRPARKRTAAILVGLSAAIAIGAFQYAGGIEHSMGRPILLTCLLAAGWAVVSALLTWIVVGRGGATLARRPLVIGLAALLTPVAVVAWMQIFHGMYFEPFQRVGYRCLILTLAMAAMPLVAFMTLRRGIEPRAPTVLGAAAGATCGAWAGVLVDLWCPLTNVRHSLVGHVAPLVVLIAVGALIGGRALGLRRV